MNKPPHHSEQSQPHAYASDCALCGWEAATQAVVDLWNMGHGWIPGAAYKELAEALGVDPMRLDHYDPSQPEGERQVPGVPIAPVFKVFELICRCDDERYFACAVHPGAKVTDPMHPDWTDKQPHVSRNEEPS